ncbi:MAG: DUF1833 family protein [Bauldia sp.]
MSDLWTAAIEEARASAPADTLELETIELIHPAFLDEEGFPGSVRGVLDERAWELELEDAAPLHGGEVVTFSPVAMRLDRPEQAADTLGQVRLAFDNVPRKYAPMFDAAVTVRATARLIIRTWTAVRDLETGAYAAPGPPGELIGELTVRDVDFTGTTTTMSARFLDLLSRGFPGRKFSREDFAALFGGDVDAG